jgi:ATP phosphoribosyltransferase
MVKVRFAIPKGSLEEATFDLLDQAGYVVVGRERSYRPQINDEEIGLKALRPQEIPIYVAEGLQDIGITGLDWIEETKARVKKLLDLRYGGVRLVVAIPNFWEKINSLSDLIECFHEGGSDLRISTEYLNVTAEHVRANPTYRDLFGDLEPLVITPWWTKGSNKGVSIFLSFGATEAKPPDNADAIVDLTETGATLDRNNLKAIGVVLESSATLIANEEALNDPEKVEKIYDVLTLLKGVVDGRGKLHIFVNVQKDNLQALLDQLPALKSPTISHLSKEGWYSVNTVIDKDRFIQILPSFRRLAQGLVVYEPRQVLSLSERRGEGDD